MLGLPTIACCSMLLGCDTRHARHPVASPLMCDDGDAATTFDATLWRRVTSWETLDGFERSALLRGLLDGDLSAQEANHCAWRALGYTMGIDGKLCSPEGTSASAPPDVLNDESWIKRMRVVLPLGDSMEEEEELAMLDTLIESLNGETITRTLIAEGDRDFLARRTLVMWLYLSQPQLQMGRQVR